MLRVKMTIKKLIKNKNYECIKIYKFVSLQHGAYWSFIGYYSSMNGKLISCCTGEDYLYDEEIYSYYEWSSPENLWKDEIPNGLTIYIRNKFDIRYNITKSDIGFMERNCPILQRSTWKKGE